MGTFDILDNLWLLSFTAVGLTALCLVLSGLHDKPVWLRSKLHRSGTSTSETLTQSTLLEKKSMQYADVLPPQGRQVLAALPGFMTGSNEVDEKEVLKHILPMTVDYRIGQDGKYTSTGFSLAEVKALGDFPDYSKLSGVPLPQAYLEFDIDKGLARPYRPFRWGYHQTMSLTKLETDWWIELENTYKQRIAQRKDLYVKHGNAVLDWLPGSELACKELMEMVLQFLCARYPQYFSLIDNRILQNRILGAEQDIRSRHPLEILLDNVPEDFGVMLRDDKTGNYFMRAGVICSALGWNVGTKIGLQLHQIHGPVPDYKEKMQFSMDRFFTKMPTDKPIQRGSWGLEVGQPLYMPKGDPHEKLRLSQDPKLQLDDCHLRVDWQTLRRLPLSGAIVFNFKALFTPVTEFRDEPGVPALVAKVLKEGKKNLMEYKSTWHVEHVILPKLEEWAKEQEENELVSRNWKVATLDDSPWYRNWEEKWHRQQGF
ncbi:hypothetical protein BDV23DRAFT_194646 [Aspergillus alliaceus]|uniref:Uncharacterized protein n=2 Tax=Petromyces alliaceus TaxID=209559 RepID=A0A5N7C4X6_PETAA|nr:uncharacterized protein BDW43DRAFT_319883 [Aspergillus alliaceus]KAB8233137.1 hypothetical protein BDW43DRAFT_319883 [Aspergillus alliaceus]KAE8389154.1 hypothetical protein BDV23DRAFT_194646 [Aspergillus alliaceus]